MREDLIDRLRREAAISARAGQLNRLNALADEFAVALESSRADAARLEEALRIAEAALADIGDADREPGDDLAWCERRAAQALPAIRAALAMMPNT